MDRQTARVALLLALGLAGAALCSYGAEDWPGYEKDNRHQNSSSVDIDPAVLQFQWEHVFSNPVDCATTNPGYHGSRNLCLVDGGIAVIARHNNTTGAGNRAYVSVVDALTGEIATCIRTNMGVGPRRDQFGGYGSVWMEAYDTGVGIAVSFWDPTTGIYYMANGGDGTDQTAYKLLENAGDFPSAMASGDWYVWGVPAFEDIRAAYPGLQDDQGNTAASLVMSDSNWDLPYGGTQGAGSNQTAFFEVPLDGDYIVKPNDSGHIQGSGYVVVNKRTGLGARLKNGLCNLSTIEPPNYSPPLTWGEWKTFKMWGGCMTTNGKVYFLGPGDDYDGSADLGDGGIQGASLVRDQGLYIGCLSFSYSDLMPNDGYTGPGTEETASPWPELWKYRYLSPSAPADLNDAESYLEQDGFYRNKAWLLDGETVWAAWKPTQAGNVQLIHCGPGGLNDTFDLGVGAGRRGQDIWPHISYVELGPTERYVVCYAGNAWYKAHAGASSSSGWDTAALGDPPLGPAELAVFDADASVLKWTYVLNAADQSGPYSSLPPNEATGYFDRSQMLVAGSHAYVAWVDVTGASATLKVVGFDVTSAPATPPTPFICDLGVASSSASKSFVMDLIAADGWLYALVTESDVMDTCEHIWDAQRIVAMEGGAPQEPGGGGGDCGGGGCGTGTFVPALLALLALRRPRR